jgi:hypothetical protein
LQVEHSIGVIKRVFGFSKVPYRGLAKTANRVFLTAALANIFVVKKTGAQLSFAVGLLDTYASPYCASSANPLIAGFFRPWV